MDLLCQWAISIIHYQPPTRWTHHHQVMSAEEMILCMTHQSLTTTPRALYKSSCTFFPMSTTHPSFVGIETVSPFSSLIKSYLKKLSYQPTSVDHYSTALFEGWGDGDSEEQNGLVVPPDLPMTTLFVISHGCVCKWSVSRSLVSESWMPRRRKMWDNVLLVQVLLEPLLLLLRTCPHQ